MASKALAGQGRFLQQLHVVPLRILDMPFHVLVPKFVLVKCINTHKVITKTLYMYVVFIVISFKCFRRVFCSKRSKEKCHYGEDGGGGGGGRRGIPFERYGNACRKF